MQGRTITLEFRYPTGLLHNPHEQEVTIVFTREDDTHRYGYVVVNGKPLEEEQGFPKEYWYVI